MQNQLTMSYAGAAEIAAQYPEYSTQIIAGGQESFLAGDQWAYLAGIIAVLLGATLVFFKFPRLDEEHRLLAEYQAVDSGATPPSPEGGRPLRPARPHERARSRRMDLSSLFHLDLGSHERGAPSRSSA